MIVTTAWMSQQFNRFNSTFFKGELPIPLFQLSRSRRVLGQFKCNKKLTLKGIKGYNFAIAMTTFYDFSEKQAQEVLLHEMIHYVIALMVGGKSVHMELYLCAFCTILTSNMVLI